MKGKILLIVLLVLVVGISGCVEPSPTPIPTPINCAKEGEKYSFLGDTVNCPGCPEHCCEGLTEWESGFDTRVSIASECYETGMESGLPVGTCINCGNGICESIEDACNCPQDCFGGEHSHYATVEDFCNTSWNRFLEPCKDVISHLPICSLCIEPSPIPTNCAKAGEISMNDVTGEYKECCSGLDEKGSLPEGTPEDCERFSNMEGFGSICTDCGNGNCEEWENRCICPEDCK